MGVRPNDLLRLSHRKTTLLSISDARVAEYTTDLIIKKATV